MQTFIIAEDQIPFVKILLQNTSDVSWKCTAAIQVFDKSSEKETFSTSIEELYKCLLKSKIDPSDDNNYIIRHASAGGYPEIVRLLLKDERVDPTIYDNAPFRCAATNGHYEVVKILLKDDRVDPTACNNYALRYAYKNGYDDIVKILLEDERVKGSNEAIELASKNGCLETV